MNGRRAPKSFGIPQSTAIRTHSTTATPKRANANSAAPNLGQNTSTAQISNVKGYQYYLINGIQVAKFVKQFKITNISKTRIQINAFPCANNGKQVEKRIIFFNSFHKTWGVWVIDFAFPR